MFPLCESGLTPNAFNEPVDSNVGIIAVFPTVSITTQPEILQL